MKSIFEVISLVSQHDNKTITSEWFNSFHLTVPTDDRKQDISQMTKRQLRLVVWWLLLQQKAKMYYLHWTEFKAFTIN